MKEKKIITKKQIGSTLYIIEHTTSDTARETAEQKLIRMMIDDMTVNRPPEVNLTISE